MRLLILLTSVICIGMLFPGAARALPSSCVVDHVIDGDTFVCSDGVHIRMLQMNAQELSDCGGQWAKAALENIFLPAGTNVRLEYDRVTTDRYGRTLAAPYAYGIDGQEYNISIVMVYVGLAKAAYYGDNSAFLDWANASETWARNAHWNMWGDNGPYVGGTNCGGGSTPEPEPAIGNGGDCDHSYPDVCIPSPPPDLNCNDISYRHFRVIPPDPHHFDGNHDGVGCEG